MRQPAMVEDDVAGAGRLESALASGRGHSLGGMLLSAGGILGAVAGSSCCVLPLLFVSLGITGSWMVNLTALEPFRPYFIAFAVLALGGGFYFAYRTPKTTACATDGSCGTVRSRTLTRAMLWTGVVFVAIGVGFPYAAPWFY